MEVAMSALLLSMTTGIDTMKLASSTVRFSSLSIPIDRVILAFLRAKRPSRPGLVARRALLVKAPPPTLYESRRHADI
jgi:hypothetical protein